MGHEFQIDAIINIPIPLYIAISEVNINLPTNITTDASIPIDRGMYPLLHLALYAKDTRDKSKQTPINGNKYTVFNRKLHPMELSSPV